DSYVFLSALFTMGMYHQQRHDAGGHSHSLPAHLTFLGVRGDADGIRIVKDKRGRFEAHAVLCAVPAILRLVPLEGHPVPIFLYILYHTYTKSARSSASPSLFPFSCFDTYPASSKPEGRSLPAARSFKARRRASSSAGVRRPWRYSVRRKSGAARSPLRVLHSMQQETRLR